MQIAIATPDGKVSLWCYHNGMDDDGSIRFSVINGAWDGKFKDNTVYVNYTKGTFPGMIVWAGEAAGLRQHENGKWSRFSDSYYNEAIAWIQDQIDDPEYAMLPLETVYEYKPDNKKFYDLDGNEWDEDDIPF